MDDKVNKKEDNKINGADEFFEENTVEGVVQEVLDYIEENGIYIRE